MDRGGTAVTLTTIDMFDIQRDKDFDLNNSRYVTPKLLLNKVNSIDPMEFERVMKDFNDRAKYSQSDRLILRFTKIFYFAAYYLIFSRMKVK